VNESRENTSKRLFGIQKQQATSNKQPINSSKNTIIKMRRTLLRYTKSTTSRDVFRGLSITNPPALATHLKPPTLITKSQLEPDDLNKLFHHEITALQIKAFHPPSHAKIIAKELSKKMTDGEVDNWRVCTERGLEVSDVWTEGEYVPYNVAVAMDRVEEYYQGVHKDFRRRRVIPEVYLASNGMEPQEASNNDNNDIQPRLWPLDQLRLELDEVWMDGAGLRRDKDKRVQGGGLPRIMMGPTRWKKGFIHADQYSPLSTKEGLFSGNIYLQLPPRSSEDADGNKKEDGDNGELNIWNLEIYSQLDWFRYQDLLKGLTTQDAELQIKLRKELGDPLKIHVEPGDLVMLCVQKPHAAVGFLDGTRISLQCFIQYRQGERLLIDI